MKFNLIYYIFLFLLVSCSNDKRKSKNGTHKISCNKVHLREFPNFNSKSLEIIEADEQVTYIKESKFKEKIKVNNQEPITNWIFCSYKDKKGWIYNGCLETTSQSYNQEIDNEIQLSNRVIAYQEVPDDFENTPNADKEKCFFSSEGDCGGGDLVFLNDQEVIFTFYCCCSSSSYRKGTYKLTKDNLICSFGKEEIFSDDPNGENKYAVTKKVIEPMSISFSINYCNTGELFFFNKIEKEKISTYGVLSSQTVEETIKRMKEENAWQYLK